MTYAQGASAEIVAMATIGAADMFGLPVSTTHVLSSGVAGTMFASKSGLQFATIRNISLGVDLHFASCGPARRRPVLDIQEPRLRAA